MAVKRSFTSRPPDQRPTEPVQFQLDGVGWVTGKEWAEVFTCVEEVNSGVLDDLASSMSQDDRGNIRWHQPSILRFMRGVLIEPDVERFNNLVHDKDRIIKIEVLGDLTLWLAEELSGHPTSGREPSTSGRPPAGPTSMDASPSPALTPAS
jgi:hypothetical protein